MTDRFCDTCGTAEQWDEDGVRYTAGSFIRCETDHGDRWYFCNYDCFETGRIAHGWPRYIPNGIGGVAS